MCTLTWCYNTTQVNKVKLNQNSKAASNNTVNQQDIKTLADKRSDNQNNSNKQNGNKKSDTKQSVNKQNDQKKDKDIPSFKLSKSQGESYQYQAKPIPLSEHYAALSKHQATSTNHPIISPKHQSMEEEGDDHEDSLNSVRTETDSNRPKPPNQSNHANHPNDPTYSPHPKYRDPQQPRGPINHPADLIQMIDSPTVMSPTGLTSPSTISPLAASPTTTERARKKFLGTELDVEHKHRNESILIVENENEQSVFLLCRLLTEMDFDPKNVVVSTTYEQAISFCRKQKFDVIFMEPDLEKALYTGITATVLIKIMGENKNTPIICQSRKTEKEILDILKDTKMETYIQKPIDKASVIGALKAVGIKDIRVPLNLKL